MKRPLLWAAGVLFVLMLSVPTIVLRKVEAEPLSGSATDTLGHPAGRHPDSTMLRTWSQLVGVRHRYTYAVAWEETRHSQDSTVRSQKRALGRFQIMDATAIRRCPAFDVRTRAGNLACFLKMTQEDIASCGGYWCAARIHNGSGPEAVAFAHRVLGTVGILSLEAP